MENSTIDKEMSIRPSTASTTFRRLTNRVWKNRHLSIRAQFSVYEACVLSILFYGAPSRVTYQPRESTLSAFHTGNLRFILGKTDNDVFKWCFQNHPGLLSSKLVFFQVHWAENVNKMPQYFIPRIFLHGALKDRTRQTGRPPLRCKDVLQRDLKDVYIEPESWTTLSKDWNSWRAKLYWYPQWHL